MSKHIYGSQPTILRLTDKAEAYYRGEEMTIFEHADRTENPETGRNETTYTYSYIMSPTGRPTTSSGPESRQMTAEQLNAELEAMADALAEIDD